MKANIFIITLLFFSSTCISQISLEQTYLPSSKDNNISIVNLANSGYKFVIQDKINKTVKLYNLNHSLWKTITLNISAGYTLETVNYISETLFNLDAQVELSYTAYKFIQTPPVSYMAYDSKIINENGNILIALQNCPFPAVYSSGINGWKLLANIDSANVNSCERLEVYSLPGSMPQLAINNESNNTILLSNPFPNPSKEVTRINYILPDGTNSAEIVLYNLNGQKVKLFQVDNTFSSLELNNSDLPAGTYLYSLIIPNNISSVKKMVIIK